MQNACSVLVTGILRVAYSYVPGSRVPSYAGAELWSIVHIGMGVVCACLPPLWPLLVRASTSLAAVSSSIWAHKDSLRSSSYPPRSRTLRQSPSVGRDDESSLEWLPLQRPGDAASREGDERAYHIPESAINRGGNLQRDWNLYAAHT